MESSSASHHHTINSDSTNLSSISIDSLDENRRPLGTSSPTKYKPSRAKGRPLRIINVNCQSLTGKKGAWSNLLETTKPDIIIATETWLNSGISDAELECDDFIIYRKDRANGGVLIAVNSMITSTEVSVVCPAEIIWVKIHCPGHRAIYIAACYRPSVSDKTFNNNLRDTLNKLNEKRHPSAFVVGGDFNYPGWDWAENCLKPNTQYSLLQIGRASCSERV